MLTTKEFKSLYIKRKCIFSKSVLTVIRYNDKIIELYDLQIHEI